MNAQKSSMFVQIGPPTAELGALERLKKSHSLIMRKTVLPLFLSCFDRIFFILTGHDDIH